jgi:hypothetical protein
VPTTAILTEDLLTATPTYDAVAVINTSPSILGGISPVAIAWTIAAGYRVGYVHPSGVLGSPVTGLPTAATYDSSTDPNNASTFAIAVSYYAANNSGVAVVWNDPSAILRVRFTQVANPSSVIITRTISNPGTAWIRVACAYTDPDSKGTNQLWWIGEDTNGATRADQHVIRTGCVKDNSIIATADTARHLLGHVLLSRAFYDAGDVYAAIAHPVQFFPYAAIVRISGASFGSAGTITVARLLPGESTGAPTRDHVTSVPAVTTRQHALCLGIRLQLSSANGDQFGEQGIRLATIDFNSALAYSSAQLGRGLYLSGALLSHYDGRRWAEADFHCAPDQVTGAASIATPSNGGGSLTSTGVYGYKICYEEIDAQGELHQGAQSVEVNVTLGGADNRVTLVIPTYRLTNKKTVRIGVYRSIANDSSEFFRVTSTDPSVTAGSNRYVANDATVNTVTFVDDLSDANCKLREPLYTNGGILSNDPPPISGGAIAVGKSRLFWTDPGDPHLVWFSQQLRDDTAAELSASLSMRTDPYGGNVVAIAVMDNGVFAFKETAIYVADGPGPDADGGASNPQNAFTPFALLTSDVGCKSARSICQTPEGIAFQSSKGIKLLGRDRQVVDIGRDVYAYNSQTITSATLFPDRHQVIFLTDSGSTLLWDYERAQWSRFTNHEGIDAAIIDDVFVYLRNDGRVFAETIGAYKDDNAHISMVIDTAWVKMAGYLQGWQKVLYAAIIGTYKSSHQLQVRYRLNYQEAYNSLTPINVDVNYNPSLYGTGAYGVGDFGGTPGPDTVYQEQVHLNKRCQAISFQFSDIEATDTFGAAFELSELLLTGGTLGTKYPMGATRSH